MRRLILKFAGLAMVGAVVSACGGDDDSPGNIVEVAQANGFSALAAAAVKAGLDDDLSASSAAGLTVFAPTNTAFNTLATQLGFADATAMVAALPASALASILSYHVLPARRSAAELAAGGATQATIYRYNGSATTLALDTTSGVRITDAALTRAAVSTADVAASNGVIHAVDKVLVPPGVLTVLQMAQVNSSFTSLVSAVNGAGLAATLNGAGPFTVFAPTNTAFAAAPTGLSTAQLTTVLTYHVLGSQVLSNQIPFGQPVATVAGQSITITAGAAPVIARITDTTSTPATITAVDVRASNGVVHVIDKVLIPNLAR